MNKNNDCHAVYIHIPFCSNICSYCDFCKIFYNEKLEISYLLSLEKEIKKIYKNDLIKTIYIGGGTPSSLTEKGLNKLFQIIKIFKLDQKYEFTFECNINDITKEKLKILKDNGVNRISIGVQTFNNEFLQLLNRDYKRENIIDKVNLTKKYFNNINVDLIYALPNQSIEDLKCDIEEFLKLDINHISTYSLILEPNTNLYIKGFKQVDENLDYEMYNIICNTLKNNDFKHYEISNFSKEGYESKHNLTYWNNDLYYGFGLGATGYINGIRYTNTRSIKHYLNGNFILTEEKLSKQEICENEMILGLRKIKGVNKKEFLNKYKYNIEDIFKIDDLIKNNYLIDDGERIYINEKYLYVSNSILVRFLGGSSNE